MAPLNYTIGLRSRHTALRVRLYIITKLKRTVWPRVQQLWRFLCLDFGDLNWPSVASQVTISVYQIQTFPLACFLWTLISDFWQRVSIACYAERCLSYDRFCLTVRPSDRLSVTVRYHAKTTPATIMRSSLEDSPMTLVSLRLASARNSKGKGSEGAEWERGRENVAKIGNF